MSISISKGGSVSLSKSAPGLSRVTVGLGWDVRGPQGSAAGGASGGAQGDEYDHLNISDEMMLFESHAAGGAGSSPSTSQSSGPASDEPFDLDATVFLLTELGRVRSDADFIFYNHRSSACGSVRHLGDNKTGEGEGDDEQIKLDLTTLPLDIAKIRVCVTIHEAEGRGQHFGMIQSAFMRVVDDANGEEIARYDLSTSGANEAAMVFGEIYREHGEWQFRAVGEPRRGGLEGLARECGVNVG